MRTQFVLRKALYRAVVLLSLLTYVSCDRGDLSNFRLLNGKGVVEGYSENDFTGQYFQSPITIKGSKSNEILMSINTKGNSGGTADRIYILQVDRGVKDVSRINFKFNKAEILFFKDFLIVNSLDEDKTIRFTINRNESESAYKKLPSDITEKVDEIFTGYGLAQAFGTWPASLEFLKNAPDAYEALDENFITSASGARAAKAANECTAGGRGSTSCSLSGEYGCSVSCSSGYYACCNSTYTITANSGCKCRS